MSATIHPSPEARARLPDLAARLADLAPVRFLAVGTVGLATDTLVFWLATRHGWTEPAARGLSLAVATFVTWQLNRRVTFSASGRPPLREAARYAAVALGAQGFNWALFCLVRAAVPTLPPLGAILFGAAAAAAFSFLGQRAITFAPAPVHPRRSGP